MMDEKQIEAFWKEWDQITENRKLGVQGTLYYTWLIEKHIDEFPRTVYFWSSLQGKIDKTWNLNTCIFDRVLFSIIIQQAAVMSGSSK
jgi:hypothetical protein